MIVYTPGGGWSLSILNPLISLFSFPLPDPLPLVSGQDREGREVKSQKGILGNFEWVTSVSVPQFLTYPMNLPHKVM